MQHGNGGGDKERQAASLKAFRISGVREAVAAAQRNGGLEEGVASDT